MITVNILTDTGARRDFIASKLSDSIIPRLSGPACIGTGKVQWAISG